MIPTRLSILLLALGSMAFAVTITFESAPAGPIASYSDGGVLFTAVGGGGQLTFPTTPNSTKGILEDSSPRKLIRADITGGASFVAVDLGDYNADADTAELWIYDASDTLLGHLSQLINSSYSGMITLSLSNPAIAYAVMGATSPAANGSSLYIDNFTYTTGGGQVPEPGTMLLVALGLTWLSAKRRKG